MWGPHVEARKLIIASCAPANGECVAEMTVGEVIVGIRRILENAAANRLGRQRHPANMRSLYASVVGIIGASQVGRHVIKLLKPFECKVLLYDPYVSDEEAEQLGVTLKRDLLELCSSCDAVSIHTPVLPATTKMLGAREFQAMHDDAVFINTSRGACIDEDALIAELEKGRLFAFLDVTLPEPAADDSPLRQLPNVVLTSHVGGFADIRMGKQAVDDIAAYIRGDSPRMVVTRDMLDRIA
jgi:phosphoglycerate dehydrogenase-like enzyme